MKRALLYTAVLLLASAAATTASAQKRGGVLRVFQYDSPASMSIHEEALNSAQNPMMVLFKQEVPQNRMDTIVPDLATKWSCNSKNTATTYNHTRSLHDALPKSTIF